MDNLPRDGTIAPACRRRSAAAFGPAALLACLATAVIGCAKTTTDTSASNGEGPGAAVVASVPSRMELGRDTYLSTCAQCHDTGINGAPVTGAPGDWTGRS